ncbi:uncharacterized protein AB675_2362 [Cyphellophora attinorum]|uniref:Uncharacterized protein n=1 Tax=Cyphellophora attinorum TaxID=1664694 RepID=A0A0N1HGJ9_9EURO|nr:uncharacterized protein AB675_2362 [Phialophora attinorum]KPI45334.1 hypothetical protein AB675_2362 [Phialophora attinorum]
MPQAETIIPSAYRLWFSTLEPLMGISGFYFNHINPTYLLRTLNPSYNVLLPMAPETRLLLDTTTGLYAQNLFLQLILRAPDPMMWVSGRSGRGVCWSWTPS